MEIREVYGTTLRSSNWSVRNEIMSLLTFFHILVVSGVSAWEHRSLPVGLAPSLHRILSHW